MQCCGFKNGLTSLSTVEGNQSGKGLIDDGLELYP